MGRKPRYSKKEKAKIIERYHKGEAASDLAREYECNRSMIYEWYKSIWQLESLHFLKLEEREHTQKNLRKHLIFKFQSLYCTRSSTLCIPSISHSSKYTGTAISSKFKNTSSEL